MNQDKILNSIFGGGLWRDKYQIDWCDFCRTAVIQCPVCKNSSCNGGGCDSCSNDADYKDFHGAKTQVENYLTKKEKRVYAKALRIKKFILESLMDGHKEIPFERYEEEGKFSQNDKEDFKNLI